MAILDEVKQIVADVLQLGDKVNDFSASTALLGSIPELDSMSVVSFIARLEEYYGFVIEDDEINAEVFETIGSLVSFVESKI